MIQECWFQDVELQAVLYRCRQYIIDNGITDVRALSIQVRADPDGEMVIGWAAVLHYTNDHE